MRDMAFLPLTGRVVNVASVPDLSPFRYPGGKTWLVPYIRQWLNSRPTKPSLFVEPFAGGAIVSLTVANEDLASHVMMIELDEEVGAVWETIINKKSGGKWLADKIAGFSLTREIVEDELKKPKPKGRSLAFQTILRNRVNRGGILAAGAGLLKEGENNNGLGSRWYPETLRKRIMDIVAMRDKITFEKGNGLEWLKRKARNTNTVFFIDPPYTIAGKKAGARLYTHCEINHAELFSIVNALAGDFLMTYSNSAIVRWLAKSYGFDTCIVTMKNSHHKKMKELLIGRDLSWRR